MSTIDISAEIDALQNAVYGEEVRGAFISCMEKIHEENQYYNDLKEAMDDTQAAIEELDAAIDAKAEAAAASATESAESAAAAAKSAAAAAASAEAAATSEANAEKYADLAAEGAASNGYFYIDAEDGSLYYVCTDNVEDISLEDDGSGGLEVVYGS